MRTGLSRLGSEESTHRVLTLSSVRGGHLDLTASRPSDLTAAEGVRYQVEPSRLYVVVRCDLDQQIRKHHWATQVRWRSRTRIDRGTGRRAKAAQMQAYVVAFAAIAPLAASSGAGSTPSDWAWWRLTDLARLESGHTPSRSRPDWWSGDIPWIQLADIRAVDGRVINYTSESTNPEGIANSAARILPADTIAMSRTASVGFVARMGRPMATSQDFVNWVCGPDLDPEFLMRLLIRSREYIRSLSAGAIHQTVYYPTVKDFHVCIPPIATQRRIAVELRERLATINQMTQAISEQVEVIEALPSALLRRAFEEIEAA